MLYSVEVAVSWYCGGAHPDSSATALTFDLRTGASYDLNKVFHVGTGRIDPAAVPIVSEYLQRMVGGDCGDMMDTLRQADLSLGVTSTFLIFYLGVPHVAIACFPPVQVPFAELSGLADKEELRRLGPPFARAVGLQSRTVDYQIVTATDNRFLKRDTTVDGIGRPRVLASAVSPLD